MPNRNYESGRRFEYKVKKEYEADGWSVIRASGSHGLFDLIAVSSGDPVQLIQCKTTKSLAKARTLMKEFNDNPPLLPQNQCPTFQQILEVSAEGQRFRITI